MFQSLDVSGRLTSAIDGAVHAFYRSPGRARRGDQGGRRRCARRPVRRPRWARCSRIRCRQAGPRRRVREGPRQRSSRSTRADEVDPVHALLVGESADRVELLAASTSTSPTRPRDGGPDDPVERRRPSDSSRVRFADAGRLHAGDDVDRLGRRPRKRRRRVRPRDRAQEGVRRRAPDREPGLPLAEHDRLRELPRRSGARLLIGDDVFQ